MTIYAEGVDYSGGWPDLAALVGKSFVVRYVAAGDRAKEITAAEVVHWRQSGKDIVIVYETTAGRALEGRTAGVVDATAGRDNVRAVGGPADGGVIYFACDVDTTSDAQRAAVVDYLTGAASVLGWERTGLYGEYEVIDYVAGRCECRWYWQTYAWSHGLLHPRALLYQYRNGVILGGVEVDLDRAYAPDFGQWPRGDDMLTDADVTFLNDAADAGKLDKLARRVMVFVRDQAGLARPVDVRALIAPLLDDEAALTSAVAAVSAAVTDKASAVLGAIAALPTDHLSDDERHALAEEIAAKVPGLEAPAVLDALAARLAQ